MKGPRGEVALALVLVATLAGVMSLAPIPQDAAYHALADGRAFLGIPNFLNVASNIAFLIVGVIGLVALQRGGRVQGAKRAWSAFFAGTALVAVGSAYYHAAPSDATLVWDRLPMTLAFMGLFAAIVSEHLSPRLEGVLLPAGGALGMASVAWWHYADDLRLYAWVQFAPLLVIVLLLLGSGARYSHRTYLAYGLICYGLAKLAEHADRAIFAATSGVVSGHTLKHLLAALAAYLVYRMLVSRSRIAAASASVTSLHSS